MFHWSEHFLLQFSEEQCQLPEPQQASDEQRICLWHAKSSSTEKKVFLITLNAHLLVTYTLFYDVYRSDN